MLVLGGGKIVLFRCRPWTILRGCPDKLGGEGACRYLKLALCDRDVNSTRSCGRRWWLGKILHVVATSECCSCIDIASGFPFHGKDTFVIMFFREREDPGHIYLNNDVGRRGGGVFHVRDGVGMGKHLIEAAIGLFRGQCGQTVAKVGKRVNPGIADPIDYADDKKGVFAHGIVIFEMYGNIFCGGVLRDGLQAFGNQRGVRLGVPRCGNIKTYARRTESRRNVDPGFAELDGALAFGRILRVETGLLVRGDICEAAVEPWRRLREFRLGTPARPKENVRSTARLFGH